MLDTGLLLINIIIGITNTFLLQWIKMKLDKDKEK